MKTWSEMVKEGEGPYDNTGEYPVGFASVGAYTLSRPELFTIVRRADIEKLEAELAEAKKAAP
jgi:hypothetical protein